MNIVYVSSEYPTNNIANGGIGSFLQTMAKSLVNQGHNVAVIGVFPIQKSAKINEDGIEVYRLKKIKIKGLNILFNYVRINYLLFKLNNKNKIDIVETSELGLAFIFKNFISSYVIRLHGGHHFLTETSKINKWKAFQEKLSFKKADAFIPITNYVKSETEKFLNYGNKPICQIYNPINLEKFKPLTINSDKFKIVFVGTIYEKKGVRQLIQAFRIVKSNYPLATLEIIGKDWFFENGKSYKTMLIEEEISNYDDIEKSIFFRGSVPYDDIPIQYAQATVCVFPSINEAQGLVVIEAMSMQKPVIFTCFGPGPEVIKDSENGILCNPNEPNNIAEKIIWVFENPEKAEEISKNARETIIEKFNITKIVDKNVSFYNSILTNKS